MSKMGQIRHGKIWRWLNLRLGLADIANLARTKEVPLHRHTVWYYLGGMTLFLFSIQVMTGILLLLYYRPSADEAYESIQFLMTEVQFGWLIRSIHSWAANLMIFTVFLHLFSVLFLRAYRAPREITWFSGMGLLMLALAFGFTGYLLPWNELALFATRVGTQIPEVIPVVGTFVGRLLRGGDDVTGATLTRFCGIHVAILPALTTFLLALHLFMVQKHGMSVPQGVEKRNPGYSRCMPFFPNFLLRDLVGWLGALGIVALLAAYFPTELGQKADPFESAPAGIRPEWYFMSMFYTLKILPSHLFGIEGEVVGIMGFGVVGALLFLFPLFDRGTQPSVARHALRVFGAALLSYMVATTYLGYTANPMK